MDEPDADGDDGEVRPAARRSLLASRPRTGAGSRPLAKESMSGPMRALQKSLHRGQARSSAGWRIQAKSLHDQITKLGKSNRMLAQDVNLARVQADAALKQRSSSATSLQLLVQRQAGQAHDLREETLRLARLDLQIASRSHDLLALQGDAKQRVITPAEASRLDRLVHQIENRLHSRKMKNNSLQSKNAELKVVQDTLRRERETSDTILANLFGQLLQVEGRIMKAVDLQTVAEQSSAESRERLGELRRDADKWYQSFSNEWTALAKVGDNSGAELVEHRAPIGQHDAAPSRLVAPRRTLLEQVGQDRSAIKQAQARLSAYEATVAKVLAATNCPDIDTVIRQLTTHDDHNFRLFSQANVLALEAEALVDDDVRKGSVGALGRDAPDPVVLAIEHRDLRAQLLAQIDQTRRRYDRDDRGCAERQQELDAVNDKVKQVCQRFVKGAPVVTLDEGLARLEEHVIRMLNKFRTVSTGKDLVHAATLIDINDDDDVDVEIRLPSTLDDHELDTADLDENVPRSVFIEFLSGAIKAHNNEVKLK